MADKVKTPSTKQIIEWIDDRLDAQQANVKGYQELLNAGNKTHSVIYNERIRKARAVVRELTALRVFIQTGSMPGVLQEGVQVEVGGSDTGTETGSVGETVRSDTPAEAL